jgi:hypothetical protein
VTAHVRPHKEAFFLHPLAERAESRYCINARVVPLLPLQAAHLQHERLCATDLKRIDYVRNLHKPCLSAK